MESKFKVGDVVRIKEYEESFEGIEAGFTYEMRKSCGKEATVIRNDIEGYDEPNYVLDTGTSHFVYPESMIVEPKTEINIKRLFSGIEDGVYVIPDFDNCKIIKDHDLIVISSGSCEIIFNENRTFFKEEKVIEIELENERRTFFWFKGLKGVREGSYVVIKHKEKEYVGKVLGISEQSKINIHDSAISSHIDVLRY